MIANPWVAFLTVASTMIVPGLRLYFQHSAEFTKRLAPKSPQPLSPNPNNQKKRGKKNGPPEPRRSRKHLPSPRGGRESLPQPRGRQTYHKGNTVTYTHVFSSLIHISFASLIHRKVRNHCKLPMKMHLRGCRRQTKREQQERQTGSQQQCFSRTSLKMHFSRLQKCVLDNLSEKNSLQSCVQVGGVGGVGGRANNVQV